MKKPLSVNATDLDTWSNRRDAQADLPQLVRKLVYASTTNIQKIEFRAGDGVQLGGWDGVVSVEKGNAFVPDDLSVWELSTSKDQKRKADSDYEKRSEDTLGIDPANATYVFVTSRRWKGKDEWALKRAQEGIWRDVRAYDADILETWLELAPAVHVWISDHLGRRPEGVEGIDSFWLRWSTATNPRTSSKLVLAGRQATVEAIHGSLDTLLKPLVICAESRLEALAVFVAALQVLPDKARDKQMSCAVIIRNISSWNLITAYDARLILVQDFESTTAHTSALSHGHLPVILQGRADRIPSGSIEVPRISREEAAKALHEMGMNERKSGELAAIARRSLTTFCRRIPTIPGYEQPLWARPDNAPSLIAALFAGRWSGDSEGDKEAISKLAGMSYENVHTNIVRWSNEDDPPVRCVGSAWYLTSAEDAWSLLSRYVTRDDLDRLQQVIIDVLRTHNPAFDVAGDQRWMAEALGHKSRYSSLLKAGLANTMAIIGAREDSLQTIGDIPLSQFINSCVNKILDTDNWKVWASLPLSLLAEAAPEDFLNAVDKGLKGKQPTLLGLFQENENDMFGSSPHVGLLWALEKIAWSDSYLVRSVVSLSRLSQLDPGGKLVNRPLRSLRMIFLPWLPGTLASSERRLDAIDTIRQRTSEIAWKLMKSLLPKGMDCQHPTARPQWREWSPDVDIRVSRIEIVNMTHEIVIRMLEDIGIDGARWSDLIEALPQLPYEDYDAVVAKLELLDTGGMLQEDLVSVWNTVRTLISRHRSYPDVDWSLPKEKVDDLVIVLARFEPQEPRYRYSWLFESNPALLEGREDDWKAYQTEIASRQCNIVQDLHRQSGIDWVPEFIEILTQSNCLGTAIARSSIADQIEDELLQKYVCSENAQYLKFIGGFIGQRVHLLGNAWTQKKSSIFRQQWSSDQCVSFCIRIPFQLATWEILIESGNDAVRKYWETVQPYYVDASDLESAVKRLLEYNRPHVAIDLLQLHMQEAKIHIELVVNALEQLVRSPKNELDERRITGHALCELLGLAANSHEIEDGRVAALEWAFLPTLGHHQFTPKLLQSELSKSPKFFAQLVGFVFRADGEDRREISEDEQSRANNAYELMQSWRFRPLPGMPEGGGIDSGAIRNWVLEAREILCADGRLNPGDSTIGQILSVVPADEDGAWPHKCIRDLTEEIESDDFEQGLFIGSINSEGVTTRAPSEGGNKERKKAEIFERWANIVCSRWGRTGSMLRRLRDHYESHAREEDNRAEIREDLSS